MVLSEPPKSLDEGLMFETSALESLWNMHSKVYLIFDIRGITD